MNVKRTIFVYVNKIIFEKEQSLERNLENGIVKQFTFDYATLENDAILPEKLIFGNSSVYSRTDRDLNLFSTLIKRKQLFMII